MIIYAMIGEGYVSNAYVGLLFEFLRARGEDPETVLGEPRPDHVHEPMGRYAMSHWAQLLEIAERHVGGSAMGIEVGRLITPAHIGILGYAVLACENLAEALARFQRYIRLVYDHGPMGMTIDGESVVLEWGEDCVQPGQLVDEVAITALVQFARNITDQQLNPEYVCFLNPAPGDTSPYQAYFGCAVEFDQPSTIVRFPLNALSLPLRQPDPVLLNILESQADKLLAELPRGDEFEQQVRRAITRRCRSGDPALTVVASDLGLSGRSLQRKLQERGRNFQQVLDETRLLLARDYLRDGRLQLTEVAQMLGYSEQSAFNHAFRRWTGSSPRSYRRSVVSA